MAREISDKLKVEGVGIFCCMGALSQHKLTHFICHVTPLLPHHRPEYTEEDAQEEAIEDEPLDEQIDGN